MMDSRVRTYSVQFEDGRSAKHLSNREAQEILKQAKHLGLYAAIHPEITPSYKNL